MSARYHMQMTCLALERVGKSYADVELCGLMRWLTLEVERRRADADPTKDAARAFALAEVDGYQRMALAAMEELVARNGG